MGPSQITLLFSEVCPLEVPLINVFENKLSYFFDCKCLYLLLLMKGSFAEYTVPCLTLFSLNVLNTCSPDFSSSLEKSTINLVITYL